MPPRWFTAMRNDPHAVKEHNSLMNEWKLPEMKLATHGIVWVILYPSNVTRFRFVKAESPCWKGEIEISLWRLALVLGWQRRPRE